MQFSESIMSSMNSARTVGIHMQNLIISAYSSHLKINPKYIIDINVKCKTITLLEIKQEKICVNLDQSRNFSYIIQSMIHKWKSLINCSPSKLKMFALQKTESQTGENICKSHFGKELLTSIYKELSNASNKKSSNPI